MQKLRLIPFAFIAVFNMGVKGAAYATGISFISGFLIMAVHFIVVAGQKRLELLSYSFGDCHSTN